MPLIWKHSIVVPIHKQGKPRIHVNSYRPIALTSHVCKLMEKIVLVRLLHHCDKHNIIPLNQAGFRAGRSTIDHLVKLTTQIKYQFAKRKGVLATFFDVTKAYDQVWHSRLLYKLKDIGLSGHIFNYIKSFLNNRKIQSKVGHSYSRIKTLHMGIPQGSVISPMLFNILMYDLPQKVSKNVTLVQYADDICMWMPVTIKTKTTLRYRNYLYKSYQNDIDALSSFMMSNGLSLSTEKTNMVLFNAGTNPENLPCLKLDNTLLKYKDTVKFLGVYLTSKLSWTNHIEYILAKARKNLNFLKIVSNQKWGQDTGTLVHLACALVRSKITYAQEVFFSAPQHLLNKLQSIDCKAFKISLGLPIHTSSLKTYGEIGILPLNDMRKLASAKYTTKMKTIAHDMDTELNVKSDVDFPKRARNISSQMTIKTYTSELTNANELCDTVVAKLPQFFPIPKWELERASFDIDHTSLKKDINLNILSTSVQSHINENYPLHLKIFTDGSVLENNNSGAAFLIPDLKVEKSFYLGKNKSIFTCELMAILMALNFVVLFPKTIFQILFCVDSKGVLYAMKSFSLKIRSEMIMEISHLIHILSLRGSDITFCWIPSHCGLYYNEKVDKAAKKGASDNLGVHYLDIAMSKHEYNSLLKTVLKNKFLNEQIRKEQNVRHHYKQFQTFSSSVFDNIHYRQIKSLAYRWKLNSFRNKTNLKIRVICGNHITIDHILNCIDLKLHLPILVENGIDTVFKNSELILIFFKQLQSSPIGSFI